MHASRVREIVLREFSTICALRWGVIKRIQLLGDTAPLKFERAKNVQNVLRFRTNVDFDCEYLWNK